MKHLLSCINQNEFEHDFKNNGWSPYAYNIDEIGKPCVTIFLGVSFSHHPHIQPLTRIIFMLLLEEGVPPGYWIYH